MKNLYHLLAGGIVLAALFASCIADVENRVVDITTIRCRLASIDTEEDFATGILDTLTATKASFSGTNFIWSLGDKIGIIPNTGSQIYFAVNDGAGTSTAAFDGGDWAMKATGTFYAYYPLYPDIFLTKDHVSVSYSGQTQSGNNNNLHTGDYWTLYTAGTTAVGNALNFSFNHLTSFFKTYVTVPAGTYTKITFSAPSKVFIKDGYFDLSAQTPTIVGTTMTDILSLDLQNVTFADETELTGYLVLAPVDITGIPITVTVYKDGAATYEYTLTKTSPMVPAKTYAFRATALTQLASSVSQANTLFASGATAVSITEPLTEDATVVLPNTADAVSLILPTTPSSSKLTISYGPSASAYPATLFITGPEGADLDIQAPNSTVTVNGIAYNHIISRTAANTCIIPAGVTVNTLKVIQGGVQVYGTVSQIDLSEQEDDAIINVSGTVTSLLGEDHEEYTPAKSVSLNKSSINLNVSATETLSATVAPTGAYPNVIWTSSDETVATVSSAGVVTAIAAGSATITAKTIYGGFTTTCSITVSSGHEYVDLGLSVKWATCNVGALAQEEYGDYFAWGETVAKSDFSWSTYNWCNGSNTTLTKYCTVSTYGNNGTIDNKTSLDPEDDVAFAYWGGLWRMPSAYDWAELKNNCTWTWTDNYNGTGVAGEIVTSNISGYTDKSIFLPAAGGMSGTAISYASKGGYYWSSSLQVDTPSQSLYNSFRAPSYGSYFYPSRFLGFSVRPVYGEKTEVSEVQLNRTTSTMVIGSFGILIATILPDNATNKAVVWASSNTSVVTVNTNGELMAVASGNATITAAATDGSGHSASCDISVITQPTPEAIDLGLSVKWASFNLGATCPEGYGSYYAWGETETKSYYDWSNYRWSQDGSQYVLSKYQCSLDPDTYGPRYGVVDEKSVLDSEDDAAITILGDSWRMPTVDEMRELLNNDNCNLEWTTINEVYGCKVTSKKAGFEGNWVFLPATGMISNETLYSANSYGYYWSSSLDWEYPSSAFSLNFGSSSQIISNGARARGQSIRPIRFNPVTSIQLNKSSLRMTPGMRETLTTTILPNDATTKTITWSSTNSSVATVSNSGVVYATAAGTATIYAIAKDGSGVCDICTVTVLTPTDLSSSGKANCYIVSSAGAYSFPTTKGNSTTTVGSVSSVEVLWESFGTSTAPSVGSIIRAVSYRSNTISFVTPPSLINGNAVIAAKDSGGNILWSWHIWVCNGYNPSGQTYYNSAGKMMDRNLGATSSTPGSVGALGLFYQWGRKDPFLGSSRISYSEEETDVQRAASTLSWPSAINSDSNTGTIAYAIAHPTTFITRNTSNYDWYYSGNTSTNTTRWGTSKTIYDPCPPGWKVPKGGSDGVWQTASGNSSGSFSYTWDSSNRGMNFSGKFGSVSNIWYPAAGSMYSASSRILDTGYGGYWWSCSVGEAALSGAKNMNCLRYVEVNGEGYLVFPRAGEFPASGLSVRCVKE